MLGAEGYDTLSLACGVKNAVLVVGIDIDHSGGALVENLELRREVIFKVRVFDGRYVVSPDIEETGGFEMKA